TGVSGSGKSSLVSQALPALVRTALGHVHEPDPEEEGEAQSAMKGRVTGIEGLRRLVAVDQKPIGRTPRSNLATYTGLFDAVRKLFAASPSARRKGFGADRFSFNLPPGRCPNCEGEGSVMVELLFLPSVYTPCPACRGARYNPETLAVKLRGHNIAQVLAFTVDEALAFFRNDAPVCRSLETLAEVGLGYLRLGQSATELSGGEAQRIKLATELQRVQHGNTLYVLDEPSTGLHAHDAARLVTLLHRLVEAGNSVVVVEHDMGIVAGADWVLDMGPGAGDEGGQVVGAGVPAEVAALSGSRTAPWLAAHLQG
ncbi:MAG: excinuclease ABC subunit A, partial [Burkholderiaceae bacterium]